MTENKRLKEVQKALGFKSQKDFALVLNIKQGSLSDIYREKQGVGVSNSIKRILNKEYSINIEWIETGNGSMKTRNVPTDNEIDKHESTTIEIIDRNSRSIEKMVEVADRNSLSIKELVDSNRVLINLLYQNGINIPNVDSTRKKGASESKNRDEENESYKTAAG